ncbi:hypothetical protein [Arcobacter sp. s6]|jgi:hypothetical protein|uniref:hypothetical protein n=1 Tax=Arcobacter sp. s6 TaxID=3230363 RepID=UPI0034A0526F
MHRVKDFIEKQIIDLEEFSYKIEEEKEFIYVLFSQILGKKKEKELTFKFFDGILFYHSLNYGWKPVEKVINNRYFWIDLLS